jgi:hypothetical protein
MSEAVQTKLRSTAPITQIGSRVELRREPVSISIQAMSACYLEEKAVPTARARHGRTMPYSPIV